MRVIEYWVRTVLFQTHGKLHGKRAVPHKVFLIGTVLKRSGVAALRWRAGLPAHRISLRLAARLLRLPPRGGSDNGVQTGNILYTVVQERRRSRLIEVGETGEAVPGLCGRDARAPRWFSSHATPPRGGSDNGVQTGNILYTVVRERRLSGLIEVVEIGEAVPALCGRDARAPRRFSSGTNREHALHRG